MIISIASGKGGTGKTTVATNLALSIGSNVQLLDCDVEQPNAHLFIHPVFDHFAGNALKYASLKPLWLSVKQFCRLMNSVTVAAAAWQFVPRMPSRKRAGNWVSFKKVISTASNSFTEN